MKVGDGVDGAASVPVARNGRGHPRVERLQGVRGGTMEMGERLVGAALTGGRGTKAVAAVEPRQPPPTPRVPPQQFAPQRTPNAVATVAQGRLLRRVDALLERRVAVRRL